MDLPDKYKGNLTLMFYISPFGNRDFAATIADEDVDPENFPEFLDSHDGRYISHIEGVNKAFYDLADDWAFHQKNSRTEKVDISDILTPGTAEDSQQEE